MPEDEESARALLDQLLQDSRLYKSSEDYRALLAFVVRLRNFAPFNAMLLQIQKPGLRYAASARDWRERFGRKPKEAARPLLILWPFGPAALVYDVVDTDGAQAPEDVQCFVAKGEVDGVTVRALANPLRRARIEVIWIDSGDAQAGRIRVVQRAKAPGDFTTYRIHVNQNHSAPTQFVTLAHELGHLTLGHLGRDKKLQIPERAGLTEAAKEIEAESVAFIVGERFGVRSKSKTYLSEYVGAHTNVDDLDVYQIMRAAGHVETLLGIAAKATFDVPGKLGGSGATAQA